MKSLLFFKNPVLYLFIIITSISVTSCSILPSNNPAQNNESPSPIASGNNATATTTSAVTEDTISPIPQTIPTETQESNQTLSPIETPVTPESDELIDDPFDLLISSDTIFPESAIKILRPGNLSRVTSPFILVANLEPGLNNQVEVELVGEDGRVLLYKIVQFETLPGYTTGNMVTEFDFEIEGVAEAGRLSVSSRDQFGRTKSLTSIDIILLSNGYTKLNPYGDLRDNVVIQQPIQNSTIAGDTLFITGLAKTREYNSLEISVVDEFGTIIYTGNASVVDTDDPEIKLFIGEINYIVIQDTPVRLIVSLPGERIPGIAYTSSIELVLSP